MTNYFYDANLVRYELYQTNEGTPYNWLFLPGGPGADSCYFRSLVDELNLPGNVWLIDFPGNGDNVQGDQPVGYDTWFTIFPEIVKKFENPVLVGHSFGGMFPLLFPEMENYLKGFVILNSAPSLWQEEAVKYSKQFDLPDLTAEMHEFSQNPSQETFDVALDACLPYYFPKETLETGRKLVSQIAFQYKPAGWWHQKIGEMSFSAKWIPQNVPTLIFGAKYDCICPFSLFKEDERFQRSNIEMQYIEDAGHFPWIENPQAVRKGFDDLISRIQNK